MNNNNNDNNKTKNCINIFSKYIKNNNKIIPLNVKISDVGSTRYFPAVSQEWKNSIYVFNQNNLKNFPVYDQDIYYLIKNFFNLEFNYKFLHKEYRSKRSILKSLNKIFTSKAEIKHTNNKAILTVYVYNREKKPLLINLWRDLEDSFYNKIKLYILKRKKILGFYNHQSAAYNKAATDQDHLSFSGYSNIINSKLITLNKKLLESLKVLRKYKLRLSLNKYKLEEKLLYKLKKFIIRFYNKKVEFNIVNLKSIIFHSDIFTKILTSKLKRKRVGNILFKMDVILNRISLADSLEKIVDDKNARIKKDLNLLENKYKNLNINSILVLEKKNLSQLLSKLYYNVIIRLIKDKKNYKNKKINKYYYKIYEIIFNSINYKNISGLRLEAKGRLTKRYRADRAVFKLRWKGGLKNIDSSYKGLSSVNYRGYAKPNVSYSIFTSKRRIGAFAVKGWVSGKL
jgi:hypothetical protein